MSGRRDKKKRRAMRDEQELRTYMNRHKHNGPECMRLAMSRMLQKKQKALKERLGIIDRANNPEIVLRPDTPKSIQVGPHFKTPKGQSSKVIDMDEAADQISKERALEKLRKDNEDA